MLDARLPGSAPVQGRRDLEPRPIRELKNYGLTCEAHGEALLAEAQVRRAKLVVADDEVLGPVKLFEIP